MPLVDEYRKEIPFTLKSRLAIAIVFSYMGDSEEVATFMQKASERTRSYFVNADGLKGFLIPSWITECLKRAQKQNQISEVTKN